jgi:hypothetical protein
MTLHRRIGGILVVAGGALFLCCGGGIDGVIFYLKSVEPPEQAIIGIWQLDRPASSYNPLVRDMQNNITLEFSKDHTYSMVLGGPVQKGTYAITGKTG